MKKRFRILFLVTVFSGLVFKMISDGADSDTVEVMPFVESASYCVKCHSDRKSNGYLKEPALSCDTYCMTCHGTMEDIRDRHHVVNVRISFKPKFSFRSSKKKRIMCITCHNLKEKRYDKVSWKAESLFEKVFKGRSRYKTYYLVMKNSNGKLCRKCHY